MNNDSHEIPEIVEREAQELSDLLTQVIERAEALKQRLQGRQQGFESSHSLCIMNDRKT